MSLPAACSSLHGYSLPGTKPSPARNRFVHLYSADGMTLEFRSTNDIKSMLTARVAKDALDAITITFPCHVPVTFPWVIGVGASATLDESLQLHLVHQLNGLDGTLTRCTTASTKCTFTQVCSSAAMQAQNAGYIRFRDTERRAECVAPFAEPYIVCFWRKNRTIPHSYSPPQEKQLWFPWQSCTNCLAVRSSALCSHWKHSHEVVDVASGGKEEIVPRGGRGRLDDAYPHSDAIVSYMEARDKTVY